MRTGAGSMSNQVGGNILLLNMVQYGQLIGQIGLGFLGIELELGWGGGPVGPGLTYRVRILKIQPESAP